MASVLYLMSGSTVLSCGEVFAGGSLRSLPSTFEVFRRNFIPAPMKNTAVTVPNLQGEARAVLNAAMTAGGVVKMAIGWSDGSAAPTVSNGEFTLPTSRSFISMTAFVPDTTERQTESGITSTIHIDVSPDLGRYLVGDDSPATSITTYAKA